MNETGRTEKPVVGFVGVGQMGQPIADQISKKYETVVANKSQEPLEHFRGRAEIAKTAAEVASRCDIVFACLPTPQSYRDVVFGKDGITSGTRVKTFIHLGTTGSPVVLEMTEALREKGVALLDAPITGGPHRARLGTIISMVSGDEECLRRAQPIIDCYSARTVYLGPRIGAAQTMKLVNNLLVVSNMVLTTEAMIMGVKGGLDPEQMLEVLKGGTGQNYAATEIFPRSVFTRNFDFGGHLQMGAKDYDCVMYEAKSLGVPVPAAEAVQRVLLAAMADQGEAADFTTIVKYVEKLAGIVFPKTRT